jgi:TusA-related sulfurtransferase
VNFIRCKLALEVLQSGDELNVQLDRGEPEEMVVPGLKDAGHGVQVLAGEEAWVALVITCGG